MVINDMDYDVDELVVEDLSDEPIETAQYIVAQVKLNKAGRRSIPSTVIILTA